MFYRTFVRLGYYDLGIRLGSNEGSLSSLPWGPERQKKLETSNDTKRLLLHPQLSQHEGIVERNFLEPVITTR